MNCFCFNSGKNKSRNIASDSDTEDIKMENENSIPKPANNLVTPLLTDLYQITMSYSFWKLGRHGELAVFELFHRNNPFKGTFCVVILFLQRLTFSYNYCIVFNHRRIHHPSWIR